MLYNDLAVSTQEEQRKLIALRILPSVHRKAKIASVIADMTLGRWLEMAILEKVEREAEQGSGTAVSST